MADSEMNWGRWAVRHGLTIGTLLLAGGIAWGQSQSEITDIKKDVEDLQIIRKDVTTLTTNQAVLKTRFDAEQVKQEEFREDTKDALNRIIRKLDEQ